MFSYSREPPPLGSEVANGNSYSLSDDWIHICKSMGLFTSDTQAVSVWSSKICYWVTKHGVRDSTTNTFG